MSVPSARSHAASGRARRAFGACAVLSALMASVLGCASSSPDDDRSAGSATNAHRPAGAADDASGAPQVALPSPWPRRPSLADTTDNDRDHDDIDDRLAPPAGADWSTLAGEADVEVVLKRPLTRTDLDAWHALGGRERYVFRAVSYGFTGKIPRRSLAKLAVRLRPALHLLTAPAEGAPCLDEATRTGRVRDAWASGFAGSTSGFSGSSDITIAVIDTGVDPTHPDLSGRLEGWKDYTTDGVATAHDVNGHGTHVTSIATGSGAAFGTATGTLHYTQSGDLTGITPGFFFPSPVHTPGYLTGQAAPLSASAVATFPGGGATSLRATYALDLGGWTSFGTTTGPSALSLPLATTSNTAAERYTGALLADPTVSTYAVVNSIEDYPAVGDGFGALRGVAPACHWFGAKVFRDDVANGNSADFGEALDDLVVQRVAHKIKIANLSLALFAPNATFRAKVNTAVDNGILVVVAAGNNGPDTEISDPGRAGRALTVGATNDLNELTEYTSIGFANPGASEDTKPDLVAPGGSQYRSGILAADSNTSDARLSSFPDAYPDDYANLFGTSMASPMVAGAAALVIEALEQGGHVWSFDGGDDPLLVKTLLLATATETGHARENAAGHAPPLGRAAAPKDLYEGYGIMNPDAAIEAVTLPWTSPLAGAVTEGRPAWQRRAWGRWLAVEQGDLVSLDLDVPATADFDLYVYAGRGNLRGDPVIRASSAHGNDGHDEALTYQAVATEKVYIVVKHVGGTGAFTLTGDVTPHCGNAVIDPGEACDPPMPGVCCVGCQLCAIADGGTDAVLDAATAFDASIDARGDADDASDDASPSKPGDASADDAAGTSVGGASVGSGAPDPVDASPDEPPLHAVGGCSCDTATRSAPPGGAWLAGLTVLAWLTRRRRRESPTP